MDVARLGRPLSIGGIGFSPVFVFAPSCGGGTEDAELRGSQKNPFWVRAPELRLWTYPECESKRSNAAICR